MNANSAIRRSSRHPRAGSHSNRRLREPQNDGHMKTTTLRRSRPPMRSGSPETIHSSTATSGSAFVSLVTFLGLNEVDFFADEAEAVVMILDLAAGQVRRTALPAGSGTTGRAIDAARRASHRADRSLDTADGPPRPRRESPDPPYRPLRPRRRQCRRRRGACRRRPADGAQPRRSQERVRSRGGARRPQGAADEARPDSLDDPRPSAARIRRRASYAPIRRAADGTGFRQAPDDGRARSGLGEALRLLRPDARRGGLARPGASRCRP